MDEAEDLLKRLRSLAAIAVCIAVSLVGIYLWIFHHGLSSSHERWGQFGDFIGGLLNPTLSFLGLLALLATFSLQLKEYRLTAQQNEDSKKIALAQASLTAQQAFESSFYNLLALHNELLQSIDLRTSTGIVKGRDSIQLFLNRLTAIRQSPGIDKTSFDEAYEKFYGGNGQEVGHYFTLLYNIFKFLDNSDIPNSDFYAKIVRAQLSNAEVALLFYNGLAARGSKFKKYIEKYSLLKSLSKVSDSDLHLIESYSPRAFGGAYPNWI
ncbi:putative phage abortive infection protein [Pseudoduganella sp. SL102]|uniref:putative phage abortive infection protein n=1 Tax=Pseudoduganella sp. SL102 TaxID=2995154 RepID=UPI00248ADD3E|nr:putative phage abortive infection protein [Pseudoduganella sp. SL102]WBS00697.1 putative phage abortive infection protein [Pseudoduganella sp. SL102]